MFTDEEAERLRRAGKIASEMRALAHEIVRERVRVIDICEKIEAVIRRRGAEPAFPCNVDINEIGAHYTSPPNDESIVPPASIVKVDIGVHIDGYISDTATSVCLNPEYTVLRQATEDALQRAIETMRPGVRVAAVGEAIQKEIEKYGFKPIRNLTGHSISRYIVHSGKHIPNVGTQDTLKIEEGDLFAIEPFATTNRGAGQVQDGRLGNIYRIIKDKPPKHPSARQLFDDLKNHFRSLPFAYRWISRASSVDNIAHAFELLVKERFVYGYPVLVERKLEPVSQSEHTILVHKNGAEVITG